MCRESLPLESASRCSRLACAIAVCARLTLFVAWFCALPPLPAAADEVGLDVEPDEATISALHAEERTQRRTVALWRTRISYPLRVSAGIGLLSARIPLEYDCRTVCRMTGWVAELEPGLAGVQLAAGYGTVLGERAARRPVIERAYLGYGVRAALLRTSADSSLRPPRQTLAGVEGQFTVIGVNVSIGAFRNISGGNPDDRWLIAGGLGFGF